MPVTRTVASFTQHNVSSSPNYNKALVPGFFTGNTNHDGVISAVDSNLMDDSENAAAPMVISKESWRTLMPPGWTGRLLCYLQAWWGLTSHPNIGFSNQNQTDMTAIAVDLAARGCDVLVPDWYSPTLATVCNDNTVDKIAIACAAAGIKYMVMIDQQYFGDNGFSPANYQTGIITAINHVMDRYAADPNYETYTVAGVPRPMVLLWDVVGKIARDGATVDWNAVRTAVTPHGNPILIQYQAGGFSVVQSDGALAWLDTNADTPGSPISGTSYLTSSFLPACTAHQNKICISSVTKGFNGTNTKSLSWSLRKYLNQQKGQTWLDWWTVNRNYVASGKRLDYIAAVTGDDFEEGTGIQCGIRTDIALNFAIKGSLGTFTVTGNENTVRQYNLWGSLDGITAIQLASVAPGAPKQFNLTSFPAITSSGTYTLYLEAQGMPNLENHMAPQTFSVAFTIDSGTVGTVTTPLPVTIPATVTIAPPQVNRVRERPLERIMLELAEKGFEPKGPLCTAIRDLVTRADKTQTNNGEIKAEANITGRTEPLGTTVSGLAATGDINATTKVFGRTEGIGTTVANMTDAGQLASTDNIAADGTGSPLTGGKRGFVALDTNNRLAGSFRSNAVNIAGTPTSSTGLSNDGISTVITVAAQSQQFGDGTISYSSGSVDPGSFGTWYIFADDPTFAGGAVTYQFSSTPQTQTATNGRVLFGKITTVSGSAKTGGGNTGGTTSGGAGGRGFIQ